MHFRIETNPREQGCRVWLDDHAVSFQNQAEAEAYVSQLQARINAAPHSFASEQACEEPL
jgi:hypothetical protein